MNNLPWLLFSGYVKILKFAIIPNPFCWIRNDSIQVKFYIFTQSDLTWSYRKISLKANRKENKDGLRVIKICIILVSLVPTLLTLRLFFVIKLCIIFVINGQFSSIHCCIKLKPCKRSKIIFEYQ